MFSKKKYFLLSLMFACALCANPFLNFAQPNTWVAVYGNFEYDGGQSICQTYDKGFVVGGTTSQNRNTDFYLLKINSQGKYVWQTSFGGIDLEKGLSVKQTSDSGFVLCGYGNNSSGNNGYDICLIKTDSVGNLEWKKNYGGKDWDFAYWAEQTKDKGFIIAGESFATYSQAFLIKTNATGDTVWTKKYGGAFSSNFKEVHQTQEGGYIAAGNIEIAAGNNDFYLVKTNASGDTLWTKRIGTSSNDSCNSVALCKDKGFLIAGIRDTLNKHKQIFFKTDSLGNIQKTVSEFGSNGNRSISRIIESVEGDYVLVANTDVGGLGGQEIRMDKYNNGGWWVWGRTFGGSANDEVYDLIQTSPDSGYALVGYTASYGAGPDNVFIVKTNSTGNYNSTVNIYVSVKEIASEQNHLAVFPNPSSGKFSLSGEKITSIKIYDTVGRIIYEQQKASTDIDISDQAPGIYLMEIKLLGGIAQKKIIIAR